MSLQKGKLFRRVQPWTASANWVLDSRPPAFIKPFGVAHWQGVEVNVTPQSVSERYKLFRNSLQFQWVGTINLPFTNWNFRVRIQPRLVNPNNVVNVRIEDDLGGHADVTWSIPPDTFWWIPAGFFITEPILLQNYSGGFTSIDSWGFACATYPEEP